MNLEPCPFCGSGKLKIVKKRKKAGFTGLDIPVYLASVSVRCNICHARGGTASGKVVACADSYAPSWAVNEQDLIQRAAELWNRRDEQLTFGL
jgi:hypothetical protein